MENDQTDFILYPVFHFPFLFSSRKYKNGQQKARELDRGIFPSRFQHYTQGIKCAFLFSLSSGRFCYEILCSFEGTASFTNALKHSTNRYLFERTLSKAERTGSMPKMAAQTRKASRTTVWTGSVLACFWNNYMTVWAHISSEARSIILRLTDRLSESIKSSKIYFVLAF
jgi:hypothetical protein